jgi:hypothetical protein
MRKALAPLALLALGATAAAQVISPAGFAAKEGNAYSGHPWTRPNHYQQIHGDLRRSEPLLIKGQTFRRDGVLATSDGFRARSIEIQMWAGEGELGALSPEFARNYTTERILVVRRKTINLPDWTNRPPVPPAEWSLCIPYDNAFCYSGCGDLVWEASVTCTSLDCDFPADASAAESPRCGDCTVIGEGCVATGQRRPMTLEGCLITLPEPNARVAGAWAGSFGPLCQHGCLLVGGKNPNLAIPNWCGKAVYSDGTIPVPVFLDATGSFMTEPVSLPYWPGIVGLELYAHLVAVDEGQRGFQVASSNGLKSTVPGLPLQANCGVVLQLDAPDALRGTATRGFGLVTRFD